MDKPRRKHGIINSLIPKEVVAAIEDRIVAGDTYQEIADWLKSKGHEVSRATVGRYGKDFQGRLERLRDVKEQAKAIIEETQGKSTFELTEAAAQVAIQKILETLMDAEDLKGESLTDLMFALSNLEKSGVAREKLKIELRLRAEKAVQNIDQAAKQKGLDEETLRIIKEQVYGIVG